MADDPKTDFKAGDDEYNIWRKILARLNTSMSLSGVANSSTLFEMDDPRTAIIRKILARLNLGIIKI